MRTVWGNLLVFALLFGLGWQAHDWHDAKTTLAANQSAEKIRAEVTEITRQSGQALENKLAELKANETHTEREIRTEVIKPVFSNVCATDDYVRLFNDSTDKAERTLSGKSPDPLPRNPATSGGADRK